MSVTRYATPAAGRGPRRLRFLHTEPEEIRRVHPTRAVLATYEAAFSRGCDLKWCRRERTWTLRDYHGREHEFRHWHQVHRFVWWEMDGRGMER